MLSDSTCSSTSSVCYKHIKQFLWLILLLICIAKNKKLVLKLTASSSSRTASTRLRHHSPFDASSSRSAATSFSWAAFISSICIFKARCLSEACSRSDSPEAVSCRRVPSTSASLERKADRRVSASASAFEAALRHACSPSMRA